MQTDNQVKPDARTECDSTGSSPARCSAAPPMRKGKNMVLMFQSAVSGLWYYNYQAAGDVSAVRVNGEIYTKQQNS